MQPPSASWLPGSLYFGGPEVGEDVSNWHRGFWNPPLPFTSKNLKLDFIFAKPLRGEAAHAQVSPRLFLVYLTLRGEEDKELLFHLLKGVRVSPSGDHLVLGLEYFTCRGAGPLFYPQLLSRLVAKPHLLTELYLVGCDVTPEQFSSLPHLPLLRLLDVSKTPLGREGVRWVQTCMLQCADLKWVCLGGRMEAWELSALQRAQAAHVVNFPDTPYLEVEAVYPVDRDLQGEFFHPGARSFMRRSELPSPTPRDLQRLFLSRGEGAWERLAGEGGDFNLLVRFTEWLTGFEPKQEGR